MNSLEVRLVHDDTPAELASGAPVRVERTESLVAWSQRRRRERDAVWYFHLEDRLQVSAHGLSLIKTAMARFDTCREPAD